MAQIRGRAARWLSLAAALALGACAAGGPLPVAPAAHMAGAELITHTLRASDGSELALSKWGPRHPKAVILAFHGYGDYGRSTFAAAAAAWAKMGIATIAIDQRGFGHNPSRGRWPGADALIDDAVAVSDQVRARFPCTPMTVVGHSMGGGIVMAAAARGLEGDALVLAAPAIWGGEYLNPLQRLLAWTAAAVVPDHRFTGDGIVEIQATDNIEALRRMSHDPLYIGRPSARELMGLVRVVDRAEAVADDVDRPALLLLGDKDQIVPNDRVREVFDQLTGPKRVIEYPDGWHLLFRDLQAANVWRDVGNWALAQTGPACHRGHTVSASASVDVPSGAGAPGNLEG